MIATPPPAENAQRAFNRASLDFGDFKKSPLRAGARGDIAVSKFRAKIKIKRDYHTVASFKEILFSSENSISGIAKTRHDIADFI